MTPLVAPCFGGPLDGQVASALTTYLEVPLDRGPYLDADPNPVRIEAPKRGVYRFERQRLAWMDLGYVTHEYPVEAWVFTTPYERYEAERQHLMDSLLFLLVLSLRFATVPRWPGHHEYVEGWQLRHLAPGYTMGTQPICRWCFQSRHLAGWPDPCKDRASSIVEARRRGAS